MKGDTQGDVLRRASRRAVRAIRDPRLIVGWTRRHVVRVLVRVGLGRRLVKSPARLEALYRTKGRGAWADGDIRAAQRAFEEAVRVRGLSSWTWIWLCRAQLKLGEGDAAKMSIAQATELATDTPPLLSRLALLQVEIGDHGAARSTVSRFQALDAPDLDSLLRVARVLHAVGDSAAAKRIVEPILARSPSRKQTIDAALIYLWGLFNEGHDEEALEFLTDLKIRDPKAAAHVAVVAFLDQNRPLDAWKIVTGAEGAGVPPKIIRLCARRLRQAGWLGAAREAAELAVRVEPKSGSAQRLLERVASEYKVLTSSWRAPAIVAGAMDPVQDRVLHIVGKSLPYVQSGYTVRTQHIASAQRRAGLDTHVLTKLNYPLTEGETDALVLEDVGGVPHHRLLECDVPMYAPDVRLDRNVETAVEAVRRIRPAILHAASDYENALIALEVGKEFDLSVVYEVRGFWEETWLSSREASAQESDYYRLRRNMEVECMQAADAVVTLAEVMREAVVERGIEREKVHVVPNAVDINVFTALDRDPALCAEWGIDATDVIIGYISSLSAYEGIHYLVEAVRALRSAELPVKALIVGDGAERNRLEQEAKRLSIEEFVIFTGRVPHAEVNRYYGMIDVFVVPRTNARVCQLVTPLKPYEAMAAGRPMVMSNTRALSELMREGETALSFTPEDVDSLVDALKVLVADGDLRERFGRAAREWVASEFTWERNAQRYGELYSQLR